MVRMTTLLAVLALALIATTPAAAKPKDGDHLPPGHARKQERIEHPEDAPGSSGWVQWCKVHWQDAGYRNHGDCVSDKAAGRDDDRDDEADDDRDAAARRTDGLDGQHGALAIADVDLNRDGTFILRGVGAEGTVIVSVGGLSRLVVGFDQTEPDSGGAWEVHGEWACQDSSSSHDARLRAFDTDEGTSTAATFPCTAED